MVFAQIKDGVVKNTVVLEDASLASLFKEGYDDILQIDATFPQPGIGWTFDGLKFKAPPIPADPALILDVTPRQMKQALVIMGVYDSIKPALDALPEPTKTLATIEWEYSLAFQRHRPIVNQIAAMLGWTQEQVDQLWKFALTL